MKSGAGMRKLVAGFMIGCAFLFPAMGFAEDIFAELAGSKNVESTYVSGRFTQGLRTWRSRNGQHALNFGDGFSSVYIYQCNSVETVEKARRLLNAYLKKNKELEVVMSTKGNGMEYVLYEQFGPDDLLKQCIIWDLTTPSMCEIVVADWKKGKVRGQKYSDYENLEETYLYFEPTDGNLMQLRALSTLSDLSSLNKLSKFK